MSFAAKYVGKRILGETLQNKFGKEDPYFEMVPATRLNGRPSKKLKKRRKALPPGLSEHDGQVLTKVKRRAYRLDMCLFSFFGVRFGWSSAIGIIPFVGDVMDMLLALMVMKTCSQVEGGLPVGLRVHMMFNIALDFVIGLVPFVGDLADALYRANTRNAMLLESHLREKGKKSLRQSGQPLPAVDPSSPVEFDRAAAADPPAYEEDSPSSGDVLSSRQETGVQRTQPAAPEPARVKESRGWFGRSKSRRNDVEMGQVDRESRPAQGSRREERH